MTGDFEEGSKISKDLSQLEKMTKLAAGSPNMACADWRRNVGSSKAGSDQHVRINP